MTDQEKTFLIVQKYFFSLQSKLKKYAMAGQSPPEYLLKNFEDAKRKMQFIFKSLK